VETPFSVIETGKDLVREFGHWTVLTFMLSSITGTWIYSEVCKEGRKQDLFCVNYFASNPMPKKQPQPLHTLGCLTHEIHMTVLKRVFSLKGWHDHAYMQSSWRWQRFKIFFTIILVQKHNCSCYDNLSPGQKSLSFYVAKPWLKFQVIQRQSHSALFVEV